MRFFDPRNSHCKFMARLVIFSLLVLTAGPDVWAASARTLKARNLDKEFLEIVRAGNPYTHGSGPNVGGGCPNEDGGMTQTDTGGCTSCNDCQTGGGDGGGGFGPGNFGPGGGGGDDGSITYQ